MNPTVIMKKALFISLLLAFSAGFSQAQKLVTKTAQVKFFSHTPVEDIQAFNNQVLSVVNLDDGSVAFSLLLKSFEFEKALMQEHFNEKYVESDKYPKATFKGVIHKDGKPMEFSEDGSFDVQAKGTMNFHGVERPINSKGTITVQGKDIKLESKLTLSPDEYNITIPGVVAEKIAKDIEVTVYATFQK